MTGIDGRIGLGGRAGRTDPGPDWKPSLIMFSISSMSDWDDWYSGTVSLCDILSIGFPTVSFTGGEWKLQGLIDDLFVDFPGKKLIRSEDEGR